MIELKLSQVSEGTEANNTISDADNHQNCPIYLVTSGSARLSAPLVAGQQSTCSSQTQAH